MAVFHYKAQNSSGQVIENTLTAATRQEASRILINRGLRPITITSQDDTSRSGSTKKLFSFKQISLGRSKKKIDTAEFLYKLLQLNRSGMPIGDAIKTVRDRITDPAQKDMAQRLWADLSEGKTLALAMKSHPGVFDDSIVYAIEAGEASGNLVPILENIVTNIRARKELRKQILAGLAYPVFITTVAFGVVGLFLFFLLPRIQGMITKLGGKMSLPAKILIGFADVMLYGTPIFIAAAIALFLYVQNLRQKETGIVKTDAWMLKIPFLNNLIQLTAYAQATNILSTLLRSGVNTTESMKLTENLIQNRILKSRFIVCRKQINDGAPISKAFRSNQFLSEIAWDILSVGENTGQIGQSFEEIYNIYKEELSDNLKLLTKLISSIALLFAFLLVTILAMSIVTSVMQFSSNLVKG